MGQPKWVASIFLWQEHVMYSPGGGLSIVFEWHVWLILVINDNLSRFVLIYLVKFFLILLRMSSLVLQCNLNLHFFLSPSLYPAFQLLLFSCFCVPIFWLPFSLWFLLVLFFLSNRLGFSPTINVYLSGFYF